MGKKQNKKTKTKKQLHLNNLPPFKSMMPPKYTPPLANRLG